MYRKRYHVTRFHSCYSLGTSWVIRDKKQNKWVPKGEIIQSFNNEESAKLECEKMNKKEHMNNKGLFMTDKEKLEQSLKRGSE